MELKLAQGIDSATVPEKKKDDFVFKVPTGTAPKAKNKARTEIRKNCWCWWINDIPTNNRMTKGSNLKRSISKQKGTKTITVGFPKLFKDREISRNLEEIILSRSAEYGACNCNEKSRCILHAIFKWEKSEPTNHNQSPKK